MGASQTRVETAAAVGRRVPNGLPMWLQAVVRFARQKPLGAWGAAVVVVMVLVAIGADYLAPYDPLKTRYHLMMQAPGAKFWLGTDTYGRDILSRIIYGSRTALLVGFSASIFGATVGAIMGVMSAYFGGKTDLVIQRVMDVLLSFPLIVLALAVVAVLGTGVENVIIAIAVPMVPRCARVRERVQGAYFPSIREYAATFGLDRTKLRYAKDDAIVMHPGPVNRGVELSHDLADHRPSVILDQVRNGVALRMALLYLIAGHVPVSSRA
ncbi:MAG: ABC transporter permease subunit [candidate division NC10 bacterium]